MCPDARKIVCPASGVFPIAGGRLPTDTFCMKYGIFCVILSGLILSCSGQDRGLGFLEREPEKPRCAERGRIGLVLGVSGLGDNSFNDMQYAGLVQARLSMPVTGFVRAPADARPETLDRVFSDLVMTDRCSLVIVSESYIMVDAVLRSAREHPEVTFVLMDHAAVALPNIASSQFAQNEVGFAAGYLAGRLSPGKPVGYIGGVDLWSVRDFLAGFEAGLARAANGSHLIVEYLSRIPDFSGFTSPGRAHSLAETMYARGARIVAAVAGASGTGIIAAARRLGHLAIGVDSDQDHLAPGAVLTSMVKRVDVAITNFVGWHLAGRLKGGRAYRFGYRERGVGLTEFEFTRTLVPPDLRRELSEIESDLAAGRIRPAGADL